MTTEKITSPITNNTLISKVNDIIENKQDILTAGTGITISNNVISATGGGAITWDYNELTETLSMLGGTAWIYNSDTETLTIG